jgi:flavin reductase
MLLACLNRRSQSAQVFPRNGVLCVNTLGADQEAIAALFSGRTPLGEVIAWRHGFWAISDAVAASPVP